MPLTPSKAMSLRRQAKTKDRVRSPEASFNDGSHCAIAVESHRRNDPSDLVRVVGPGRIKDSSLISLEDDFL